MMSSWHIDITSKIHKRFQGALSQKRSHNGNIYVVLKLKLDTEHNILYLTQHLQNKMFANMIKNNFKNISLKTKINELRVYAT